MIDSNTRESIADSLRCWDRPAAARRAAEAEELRAQFVQRFPLTVWPQLPLEDYALGQNFHDTVSWWLEYKTEVIGSIKGGSAHKHLIFRAKDGSWRFPVEYESVERAWAAIRNGFVEMLNLASSGKFDDADDIKVLTSASAVRTKLLYMYFPGDLVPVSSKADIDHFLRAIGEPAPAPSVVRANRQLLAALHGIPELAELSNHELGFFLYHWNNPRPSQRVVKIAPGERGMFWDDCLKNGYICVGWDDVGDLTQYDSKETFREAFRQHYPYNGVEHHVSRKANELWSLMELQPGDTVIANRGVSEVLGVGTVSDVGYVWRPERDQYKHTVGVDWDTSVARTIEPVRAWATTTVSKVPATILRQVLGIGPTSKPVEADEKYLELEAALRRRGQVVLYGPPGTGKTFVANRAAVWLLGGGSGSERANAMLADEDVFAERQRALSAAPAVGKRVARLTRITFHPSYAYEDFIEGFRPRQSESGALQLMLTDGVFKRVCDAAGSDPNNHYIVLIDEINRGNIPKIFGELITLIEKDKRGLAVQLSQSGDSFSVPENLFIIGTMNTADRSIHLLDTALRRRFQFIELLPESDLLEGRTAGALALDAFLDGLNDEIRHRFGRDKQIGHAMFYQDGQVIDTPQDFASVFRYELLPLLQEYFYDDYRALADLLGAVIDVDTERTAELASDPEGLCAELASKFGSASA
jgi:5-methylcytosine-specific restriction protein B